jgi:hypothetical protein
MKTLLFILFFASLNAHAYFQMDFLKNKNSAKASSRWTLADWLQQKSKARLADQWLAANRAAGQLVEVNLGGGYNQYEVKTGAASAAVDHHSQSYQLDTYISFFNLMGEYEKTDNDKESMAGAAGLRLLGSSSQTTNLVARYGIRQLKDTVTDEVWKNNFAEGQLQLYVISAFGLQGKYRYYFPHDSSSGNKLAGHRVTAGAFLEFGLLRLFGDYYQEPMELTPAGGAAVKQDRTGFEYGIKLFF